MHTLELPKLQAEATLDPTCPVLKWGRFFNASTDEELEQLAMADPDIHAAKQALDRLSADPLAQQIARDRELAVWNYEYGLHLAEQKGEAKGKAEGEAKGKAEGEAKGKAEGEAKGKADALRSVLAKLLTLKFGTVPQTAQLRIATASETTLERWAELVLSAPSLEAVLTEPVD